MYKNVEEVVQVTKAIPFIGSKREIKEAEQEWYNKVEAIFVKTVG